MEYHIYIDGSSRQIEIRMMGKLSYVIFTLGLMELLNFVAFCYLANRWSNTENSWLEEKGFEQWQRRNARSVIFFAFVALLAWVSASSRARSRAFPLARTHIHRAVEKRPLLLQWSHFVQSSISLAR